MSGNIYSLIASYLEHQRDIGIHDIVFDGGSEIGKLLGRGKPPVGTVGIDVSSRQPSNAAPMGYGENRSGADAVNRSAADAARKPAAAPKPAASKLEALSLVDDLEMRKFRGSARPQAPSTSRRPPAAPVPAKVQSAKRDSLTVLYRETVVCDRCRLSEGREKVVFGTGSADGRLFIIGGAPSRTDESAGLPFQGETGKLLDNIIAKMGLNMRADIFATYLQKCRGADDCSIDNACAKTCRSILERQIEIIAPQAILVFGTHEAKFFLESDIDVEFMRGMNHTYKDNIPVFVTYDLQFMLDKPQSRKDAWGDMQRVLDIMK